MIGGFFICFHLLLIEYFVCLVCVFLSVEMEIKVVCSFNEFMHFFAKYNSIIHGVC